MSQSRTPKDPGILERARYFPRQVVSPSDLSQDQSFFIDKLRRHNRLLHGWGFCFGLEIKRMSDQQDRDAQVKEVQGQIDKGYLSKSTTADDYVDYWVRVTPGYALSPLGDEVYLPREVFVNTHEEVQGALVVQPGECPVGISPRTRPTRNDKMYLLIEAYESQVLPTPSASNRCGDHPDQFEYSRIRDTLRFSLSAKPEPPPYGDPFDPLTWLTGQDPKTGKRVRNDLTLGAIQCQKDKIVQVNPPDNGRDQQFAQTQPSPPAPGGQTAGTGSLDELGSFRDLRPEARNVLRSFVQSPRDIADYASKEVFVQTMTDLFNRRVPDTLGSVWDDARRACGL
jgi:hypothetical protein